jgi:hypothetical protein
MAGFLGFERLGAGIESVQVNDIHELKSSSKNGKPRGLPFLPPLARKTCST